MKKVIHKTDAVMLMANPKVEIEVSYKNRPKFQKLMTGLRENTADVIMMPRLADLSRNPEDVKAACKEILDMNKEVHFVIDDLKGRDVLKMSYDELLKITTATLKDDMVIIVDSPEAAQKIISQCTNNDSMTMR